MKKLALVTLVVLVAASMAMATTYTYAGPANDVLGAHNGYGRGCVMCHAPHSGSRGNGLATSSDPQNGEFALWGQDLTPLFGLSTSFSGDGKATYAVTLPAAGTITSAHDANTIILFCLSCHDGNLAHVGMMQGQTVETLPIVGGTAPTLLGADAQGYANDHPVGGYAVVNCGGTYDWDCTGGNTTPISMNGTGSAAFLTNYPASFWNSGATPGLNQKLATFGTTVTAVACTSCHDQHSMTVYKNNNGAFSTMFFVRGQYTPSANGNAVAQFCRNCHGGESNEMHGLMAVPTV